MAQLTFTDKMELALELYKNGEAVQLRDKHGEILLGAEIPETIDPKNIRVIDGIDVNEWKRSDWSQVLESAQYWSLKNNAAKK